MEACGCLPTEKAITAGQPNVFSFVKCFAWWFPANCADLLVRRSDFTASTEDGFAQLRVQVSSKSELNKTETY